MLKVTIQGAALAMEATAAPNPRLTKVIGIAQHNNVPEVVNNNTQLQRLGFIDSVTLSPQ